jgi:hypothetical protein
LDAYSVSLRQGKKSVYAPIGPFGKWRVFVNPDWNTGLNWDNVQAIVIDFHVFKQAFDADLARAVGAGSNLPCCAP